MFLFLFFKAMYIQQCGNIIPVAEKRITGQSFPNEDEKETVQCNSINLVSFQMYNRQINKRGSFQVLVRGSCASLH